MAFPNLSNSLYVAQLRYIQTIREPLEQRNPDVLVGRFIPMKQRLRTALMTKKTLSRFRSDPFYYYLLARTIYYDRVVQDAIADGIQRLVMVGCGSDTRSYRFQEALASRNIKILECDQPASIQERKRITQSWPHSGRVEHMGIDLNDGEWPQFAHWFGNDKPKALVMLEGVSPYINDGAFTRFLQLLSSRLASGSHLAYDFKIRGLRDDFGKEGRTDKPFRLSTSKDEAIKFHQPLGFQLEHMELSSELTRRLLSNLNGYSIFEEDGLLRLRVKGAGQ